MIDAVSMISDNGQFFKQLTVEGSVITAGQVLLFLQLINNSFVIADIQLTSIRRRKSCDLPCAWGWDLCFWRVSRWRCWRRGVCLASSAPVFQGRDTPRREQSEDSARAGWRTPPVEIQIRFVQWKELRRVMWAWRKKNGLQRLTNAAWKWFAAPCGSCRWRARGCSHRRRRPQPRRRWTASAKWLSAAPIRSWCLAASFESAAPARWNATRPLRTPNLASVNPNIQSNIPTFLLEICTNQHLRIAFGLFNVYLHGRRGHGVAGTGPRYQKKILIHKNLI